MRQTIRSIGLTAILASGLIAALDTTPALAQSADNSCRTYSTPASRVAYIDSSGAWVNEGSTVSSWVHEFGGADYVTVSGNRIGILSGGDAWVKEGDLYAGWTLVASGVSRLSLSGDRIGVIINGDAYVKEGPVSGEWVTLTRGGVTDIVLSGRRIGVIQGPTAWVKEGPVTADWVKLLDGGVTDLSITPDRVGAILNKSAYVKEGSLHSSWVEEISEATEISLAGNRIGVVAYGSAYVKDGSLYEQWINVAPNATSIVLGDDRIGVISGGRASVKEGSVHANWAPQVPGVSSLSISSNDVPSCPPPSTPPSTDDGADGCEVIINGDQSPTNDDDNACFVYSSPEPPHTPLGLYRKACSAGCTSAGGYGGPALTAGPGVGIPVTSGLTGSAPLGGVLVTGAAVATTSLVVEDIKQLADRFAVPWPDAGSTSAKKYKNYKYKIYQIWAQPTRDVPLERTYKFGITRQEGSVRPQGQLPACRKEFDRIDGRTSNSCKWDWVLKDVDGWWKARSWEALLALRYKVVHGQCPVGMPKCL